MLHARDAESTGSGVEATALGLYGGVNLEVGGSGQVLALDLEPQGRGGALPFPGCAAWGEFLALSGPKGPISDKRKEEACSDFPPAGGPQTLCSCVRRYYQQLGKITAGRHFCLNKKKNHLILG